MRVAFYAPLKPPTHETPSGDRRMARLLIAALEAGRHQVALASEFRSFEGQGRPELQQAMASAGKVEAEHILETYLAAAPEARPEIWFTYHLYYKAPDFLGPLISRRLNIPYVVAEPSYAPKRAGGPWDQGHESVGQTLRQADAVLCLTAHDMACVAPLIDKKERLHHLPPFLEAEPYNNASTERAEARAGLAKRFDIDPDLTWLIAVGMMRSGDKLESYRRLATALEALEGADWCLLTVGDGEARAEVHAALAVLSPQQIVHLGAIEADQMPKTLAAADLFVWPAAGEAYGMAMLEAQASGLPVIAGDLRGVPEVVKHDRTGLLVPENEPVLFARAVRQLIDDDALRAKMAVAASEFVTNERSVAKAADILNSALK